MKLAKWRQERALTQHAVADAIGVSQSVISGMERLTAPILPRTPKLHAVLQRLFRYTGGAVTPNDFFDLPDLDTPELPLELGSESAPLLQVVDA